MIPALRSMIRMESSIFLHILPSTRTLHAALPAYNNNNNDPTSGLARQFSNQNLGSNQRQASPLVRQPSPNNQRPRNAPGPGHNTYGNHLALPINGTSATESDDRPPERNPEKYSSNLQKRGQVLHASVEAFFKENISRARDRNIR